MDNRIDLQCCIILSPAAGWARPHTDTGEEMTQVRQCSVYCVTSSCDQSTACLHNLVPGDWQLTPSPSCCLCPVIAANTLYTEVIATIGHTGH